MRDKLLYKEECRLSSEFAKTSLRGSKEYNSYIGILLRSSEYNQIFILYTCL